MKFKLEFNMDNASFDEIPEHEIIRMLNITDRYVLNGERERIIKDSNGNTIGKWFIE